MAAKEGATDGVDPHARPTTALHADELRRLAGRTGRADDTPARVAKSSSTVRSERLDTRTAELDPAQLGALLAAEPRTSPAVVDRRADTHVDVEPAGDDRDDRDDRATSVIDPAQLRAMAAEVARDVDAARVVDHLPAATIGARRSRPRQLLARLRTSAPLPPAPRDHTGLVLVVLAIAMAAIAALLVMR